VYQYTHDVTWLTSLWPQFTAGVSVSAAKIGSGGLMNVTLSSDWARSDMGGENIAGKSTKHFDQTSNRCCS
jgi:hypothetical protein